MTAVIRAAGVAPGTGCGIRLRLMRAVLERRGSLAREVGMRHGNVGGGRQLAKQRDDGNHATTHRAAHGSRVPPGRAHRAGVMIRSVVRPPRSFNGKKLR